MCDAEKPENEPEGLPEEQSQAELAPEDWQESSELGSAEVSPEELRTYDVAIRKIQWMTGGVGAICAAALVRPFGWTVAAGLLLGTFMGWLNFRWLVASVNAISERIVNAKSRERGAAIVARGIARILLMLVAAYGIFRCSVRGLEGFLAGLTMPVVAILCFAMHEFVANIRRSS